MIQRSAGNWRRQQRCCLDKENGAEKSSVFLSARVYIIYLRGRFYPERERTVTMIPRFKSGGLPLEINTDI